MSSPNGQQGEPVAYEDVLSYWREQVIDLHSRLSMSAALLKNREREIAELRGQINQGLRDQLSAKAAVREPIEEHPAGG